jgi:hypothetical protein
MVLTLLLAICFSRETIVSQFEEAKIAPGDQFIVNLDLQIVLLLEGSSSTKVVTEELEELDDGGEDNPDNSSKDDPSDRNRYREKEEAALQNMITEQGLVEILERILSFRAFYKCEHPFKWNSPKDHSQEDVAKNDSGICESYV